MSDPYMRQLVTDYRTARERLLSHRGNLFKNHALVHVDCPRYLGLGVVDSDPACPPDQVPVLLCNGNTWWYPVESVTPVDAPMPRELRRVVLTKAGIHHL